MVCLAVVFPLETNQIKTIADLKFRQRPVIDDNSILAALSSFAFCLDLILKTFELA